MTYQHTCTTQAGECRACDALTEAWVVEHGDPEAVTSWFARPDHDALASGSVRSGLALEDLMGEDVATYATDPQHAYATDTDAQREALRRCRVSLPVVADVLRQTAREGEAPSRVRADMKATVSAVRATYATTSREASDALPFVGEATRWMPAAAPDARTYAGPVVATASDGTRECYTIRHHYARRLMVGPLPKGTPDSDRPTISHRWTTREDHDARLAPFALMGDGGAFGDAGTAYRPDANTREADRFARAGEPLGPVRKPSSRKRRRDGAMGGPAVISHR